MIDSDLRTLHIRCGSDIREKLRIAGFGGDFLEYSDPIHDGPVPDVPNLIERRARKLADAMGSLLGFTEADCFARLSDAEQRLTDACRYERVVLWFEHDIYDQLILARCLSRLADGPLPAILELICIDEHPDVPRFNGLGQLEPQALADLWTKRQPVTRDQFGLGQAIWTALRQTDPTGLQAIASTCTPALPIAARALWRHLRELPSSTGGLSLTQRLILDILTEGPSSIGRIFAAMVQGREPLVFMGDIGVLQIVEDMARTDPPVLTVEPADKPFTRMASVTETGRCVLAGTLDFISLKPSDRWVGNVIADGAWRFDEATVSVVRGAPR